MKNLRKVSLIVNILFITFFIYSFTKPDMPPKNPETTISFEQAKLNRSKYISNHPDIVSDVTFDYEQVKKFIDLIEYKKSKGEDISKIRFYMSQYQDG